MSERAPRYLVGDSLRFYSNWSILAETLFHPLLYWREWRHGNNILNGYWFSYPERFR